ncbi:hypothetical protein UY3_10506 [Chelonia mydas]|uniref:Uncharacterized protein n=1 Tax=Chelonia mydas TaxID=8469 RepID=M7B5A0_CHEMY|nr:hypothetical protein UY3_10506 [Chelonia mydas]
MDKENKPLRLSPRPGRYPDTDPPAQEKAAHKYLESPSPSHQALSVNGKAFYQAVAEGKQAVIEVYGNEEHRTVGSNPGSPGVNGIFAVGFDAAGISPQPVRTWALLFFMQSEHTTMIFSTSEEGSFRS